VLIAAQFSSNPFGVVIVAIVIWLASRPIIRWVVEKEQNPWLLRILTWSLLLHLLAAPAQIFVVNHLYHGIADWVRYETQGGILAPDFRAFNFTLAHANVRGIVNDGSVSIFAGVVMAIVGVNQLATFLAFSWFSWLGTILFYRAFTTTFPEAKRGHRRYAYLVFFLPSTIFWTADISKEAMMTISLGIVAFGCAKVLTRAAGGFRIVTLGVAAGALVRPNELLVVLGGFAVALMVRPSGGRGRQNPVTRVAGLLFMGLLLSVSIYLTLHYLKLGGNGSTTIDLGNTTKNNQGSGAGFGSSGLTYSSSPLRWPIDAYTVLFDPLPINAHGSGEYAAAVENAVILGIVVASWRQLRIMPRAAFARAYVMMCLVYSIVFVYAFAALGNLGLIYRERVMLLPFLMVLFAIPRSPKSGPNRFEWEYRRKDRAAARAALIRRQRVLSQLQQANVTGRLPRAATSHVKVMEKRPHRASEQVENSSAEGTEADAGGSRSPGPSP
jgi:hypothetical protein